MNKRYLKTVLMSFSLSCLFAFVACTGKQADGDGAKDSVPGADSTQVVPVAPEAKDSAVVKKEKVYLSDDLHTYDLMGKVKTSKSEACPCDASGNATGEYYSVEDPLSFSPEGQLEVKKGHNVKRNKDGRITSHHYIVPGEEWFGEIGDSYSYNDHGAVKKITTIGLENYVEYEAEYDAAGNLVKLTGAGSAEGDDYTLEKLFRIQQTDGQGNWTVRVVKETFKSETYNNTEYSLEKRTIEYYK